MKIENNVLLKVTEMDIDENGCFRIPDGVTEIKAYAFAWRISLKKITIPDSVIKIGNCAFFNCISMKETTISSNMTEIEEDTFRGCKSLEKIVIPESVKTIEDFAFYGCKSLKGITILNDLASIDDYVFENCKNLRQIDFAGQTYPVKCVDGSCMRVLHKKQMQDITILKCMYFPETEEIVYVAEKDRFSAHGETIHKAIEDLQFKILQGRNLKEHIQRIKQQGYMNANDYRLITGACREGTDRFLQEHGLTWEDTMPVEQVLEITKGRYGFDKFRKAAEQILQD